MTLSRSAEPVTVMSRLHAPLYTGRTTQAPQCLTAPLLPQCIHEQDVNVVHLHTSRRCSVSRIRSCPLPRELSYQPDWNKAAEAQFVLNNKHLSILH